MECPPAEQLRYIKQNAHAHRYFAGLVMHDVEHPDRLIEARPKKGNPANAASYWEDPLTLVDASGDVAAYVRRNDTGHIQSLAADKAKVFEYIGNRAVPIKHAAKFVVRRTIKATRPPYGQASNPVPSFRDRQDHAYGYEAFIVVADTINP